MIDPLLISSSVSTASQHSDQPPTVLACATPDRPPPAAPHACLPLPACPAPPCTHIIPPANRCVATARTLLTCSRRESWTMPSYGWSQSYGSSSHSQVNTACGRRQHKAVSMPGLCWPANSCRRESRHQLNAHARSESDRVCLFEPLLLAAAALLTVLRCYCCCHLVCLHPTAYEILELYLELVAVRSAMIAQSKAIPGDMMEVGVREGGRDTCWF